MNFTFAFACLCLAATLQESFSIEGNKWKTRSSRKRKLNQSYNEKWPVNGDANDYDYENQNPEGEQTYHLSPENNPGFTEWINSIKKDLSEDDYANFESVFGRTEHELKGTRTGAAAAQSDPTVSNAFMPMLNYQSYGNGRPSNQPESDSDESDDNTNYGNNRKYSVASDPETTYYFPPIRRRKDKIGYSDDRKNNAASGSVTIFDNLTAKRRNINIGNRGKVGNGMHNVANRPMTTIFDPTDKRRKSNGGNRGYNYKDAPSSMTISGDQVTNRRKIANVGNRGKRKNDAASSMTISGDQVTNRRKIANVGNRSNRKNYAASSGTSSGDHLTNRRNIANVGNRGNRENDAASSVTISGDQVTNRRKIANVGNRSNRKNYAASSVTSSGDQLTNRRNIANVGNRGNRENDVGSSVTISGDQVINRRKNANVGSRGNRKNDAASLTTISGDQVTNRRKIANVGNRGNRKNDAASSITISGDQLTNRRKIANVGNRGNRKNDAASSMTIPVDQVTNRRKIASVGKRGNRKNKAASSMTISGDQVTNRRKIASVGKRGNRKNDAASSMTISGDQVTNRRKIASVGKRGNRKNDAASSMTISGDQVTTRRKNKVGNRGNRNNGAAPSSATTSGDPIKNRRKGNRRNRGNNNDKVANDIAENRKKNKVTDSTKTPSVGKRRRKSRRKIGNKKRESDITTTRTASELFSSNNGELRSKSNLHELLASYRMIHPDLESRNHPARYSYQDMKNNEDTRFVTHGRERNSIARIRKHGCSVTNRPTLQIITEPKNMCRNKGKACSIHCGRNFAHNKGICLAKNPMMHDEITMTNKICACLYCEKPDKGSNCFKAFSPVKNLVKSTQLCNGENNIIFKKNNEISKIMKILARGTGNGDDGKGKAERKLAVPPPSTNCKQYCKLTHSDAVGGECVMELAKKQIQVMCVCLRCENAPNEMIERSDRSQYNGARKYLPAIGRD